MISVMPHALWDARDVGARGGSRTIVLATLVVCIIFVLSIQFATTSPGGSQIIVHHYA